MIARTQPAVRLRPAPALDPPYDDEVAPQPWGTQLILQLDGTPRRRPTPPIALTPPAAPHAAVMAAPTTAAPTTAAAAAAVATASPDARKAAKRFLDMCLEIFNGYRPIGHVRPLAGPLNAETIVEQLAAGLDRTERLRRACEPGRPARRPNAFVQLRQLRVCEPRPGIAEAAAALGLAGRTWAMAFRLERRRGTWLCATVRVV